MVDILKQIIEEKGHVTIYVDNTPYYIVSEDDVLSFNVRCIDDLGLEFTFTYSEVARYE